VGHFHGSTTLSLAVASVLLTDLQNIVPITKFVDKKWNEEVANLQTSVHKTALAASWLPQQLTFKYHKIWTITLCFGFVLLVLNMCYSTPDPLGQLKASHQYATRHCMVPSQPPMILRWWTTLVSICLCQCTKFDQLTATAGVLGALQHSGS